MRNQKSYRPDTARLVGALGCLFLVMSTASAQNSGGIYSCTDARGRRLTSDRPIVACLDREQHELGPSGIVKRVVPPSYTADERALIDAKRKREEAESALIAEDKRRNRALMMRYPNKAMHDKERAEAIGLIDEVMAAVSKQGKTLADQRRAIGLELEFYENDENKAPPWLKRRIQDNAEQTKSQQRFLIEQAQEKQRVTSRFDEELVKLRDLWAR